MSWYDRLCVQSRPLTCQAASRSSDADQYIGSGASLLVQMTGPFLISTYHLCRTKFFPFGYSLYFPLRMIHDVRKGTSLASPEIQSRPTPVLIIFTGPCDYQLYNVLFAFTMKSYFQRRIQHKCHLYFNPLPLTPCIF